MEKLQVRKALSAYQVVVDRGTRKSDEHFFDGMYASSDHDGYNLLLRDDKVRLQITFHNRFQLDYRHRNDLQNFLDHIEKLNRLDAA